MLTPEDRREMRLEIARQLNVILSGAAGNNSSIENEDITNLYPGSPQISARPVMHPFGLASRAPAGTIQVTAKHGADAQNRMVLGHRDALRAALGLDEGETAIYASDGMTVLSKVTLSNTKGIVAEIAEAGVLSLTKGPVEFVAQLIQLFTDIQGAVTLTMLGNQPLIMPTFTEDLAKLQTFTEGT